MSNGEMKMATKESLIKMIETTFCLALSRRQLDMIDKARTPCSFTGELNYVINKMRTMQKAGYKVIKKVAHSNRMVTIHMEKKVY